MIRLNRTLILILAVCLIACAPKKYLWLSELQSSHSADDERVIRVYFDRNGMLYPDNKVFIDPRYFLPDKNINGLSSGNLEAYFNDNTQKKELDKRYGAGDFKLIQQKIRADFKEQADNIKKQFPIKKLVIFIHGFNDPNPTGSYQELRDHINIEGYDKQDLLYLEVYWDGLTANGKSPGVSGIWGRAQLNSRFVSLGLRELLNEVNTTLPEVIITHSLGAGVGTGVLFNTVQKWKPNSSIDPLIQARSQIPVPKVPVYLGMLAPAIPGIATFADFRNRDQVPAPASDNIKRVVLGLNIHDYALQKGFFGRSQFLAPRMGSTALGCDYRKESEKVKDLLRQDYGNLVDGLFKPYKFDTKQAYGNFNEHALHFYLQDQTHLKSFLADLFNN